MIKLMDILNEIWPFGKKQSDNPQPTPQPPAKKKPGEVWQTPAGRFAAINKSHPNEPRYFDTEEKARNYATAKIKKPTPQPKQPSRPTDTTLPQRKPSADKPRFNRDIVAKANDAYNKRRDAIQSRLLRQTDIERREREETDDGSSW